MSSLSSILSFPRWTSHRRDTCLELWCKQPRWTPDPSRPARAVTMAVDGGARFDLDKLGWVCGPIPLLSLGREFELWVPLHRRPLPPKDE